MSTKSVVIPPDPARARVAVELRQGSRSGTHGRSRGRRRANLRRAAITFERRAG